MSLDAYQPCPCGIDKKIKFCCGTEILDDLAKIEEAVDTIAVEMERMGEGQRFVTKLLADRTTQQLPDGQKNGGSGRVTTPH